MDIENQKDILKYLAAQPDTSRFIEIIPVSFFQLKEDQLLMELLKKYYKKYTQLPSAKGLKKFLTREVTDLADSFRGFIEKEIDKLFSPLQDLNLTKEIILEECQRTMVLNIMKEWAPKTDTITQSDLSKIMGELVRVSKLGESSVADDPPLNLVTDYNTVPEDVNSIPTFLRGLNKLTADGGFYCPQNIVFISMPKGFKTGLLVNLAVDFAIRGHKVCYYEFENGKRNILNRVKQKLLQCTKQELYNISDLLNENSITLKECLDHIISWINKIGGDIRIQTFPARITDLSEIEADLSYVTSEGWIPEVIFYDYLDLAASTNKSLKEPRLIVQDVYHHAVRINSKYKTFDITASQVNRGGIRRNFIQPEDIAEDWGKFMNAHALFSINRTKEELEMGIARIAVMMQRDGERPNEHNFVTIKIEEDIQTITEVLPQELLPERLRKQVTDE